jgi:hypothetical protein
VTLLPSLALRFDARMALLRSDDQRTARARLEEERRRRDEQPARRFEYTVLRVGSKARAEGPLNELGSKGWQLVQVVEMEGHLAFYLEREVFPLEPGDVESAQPEERASPDTEPAEVTAPAAD